METALQPDAEPEMWALTEHSVSYLFRPDTWTLPSPTLGLTPAHALSIAVETSEGDAYDTLVLARLLTFRKDMLAAARDGREKGRLSELHIHRPCSSRSRWSASPRSRCSTSPRSRR
jgi:hypothetical protein